MKRKIQSIITLGALIVLILISVSSCDESFLEPEPLDFYAPENVLNTEAGLQAVLDRSLVYERRNNQ